MFSPNTGKHGLEENPYLDTFHAVGDYHNPKNTDIPHISALNNSK